MLTLYVSNDRDVPSRHDPGSVLCLAVIDQSTLKSSVSVVPVESLGKQRPPWLTGAPILVQEDTMEVHKGFEAFSHLLRLALVVAHRRGREDERADAAVQAAAAELPGRGGRRRRRSGDGGARGGRGRRADARESVGVPHRR